tara:strand:- start:34 stop:948 length:915 start_codon:yes stop_codon:yes gene_type:complete
MTRYKIFYSQNAGSSSSSSSNNTYNIFTTGIVNWSVFDDDEQNLINFWNNELKNIIISKIPDNFTEIIIYHYDPILTTFEGNLIQLPEGLQRNEIKDYVYKNLILNDKVTDRVNDSEFINTELDIDTVQEIGQPYIVLDFAHIFRYIQIPNYVTYSNYYGKRLKQDPLQLNVLRTGFIGNGFGRDFSKANTFRINPDGSLYTYIDKMIDLRIDYNIDEPQKYFEEIVVEINNLIIDNIKALKGVDSMFKVQHIIDEVKPSDVDLINSIMIRFWDDKPRQQIIEEVVNYYIEKNFDKISEMIPIE